MVSNAQNFNVTNHRTFEQLYIFSLDTSSNFHAGIKPYALNEVNRVFFIDTVLDQNNINTNSTLMNLILNKNLISSKKEKFSLYINPIINAGIGAEKLSNRTVTLSEIAFGLSIKSSFKKKWSGEFDFLADNSQYPLHIDYLLKAQNAGQGYGYTDNQQALYYQGNLTFTADDVFTFQAGVGKNFIGDGYRSLFLSDYANSYPYFKATATFWKIKYMALYTNFQDIRFGNGDYSDFHQKFSTIHYLSYNATKWLNIGFFESIVFQAQEGNYYRGYELSYLNPIIFLRPVEYYQGSADNALMGGSLKIKIKKKNILYGQVLLDEFLLAEIKANNGWWANKYGYQIGLKSYNVFGINGLKIQLEYNTVRPFTYSYFENPSSLNTLQNYGHYNSPLAHPLGANFKEVIGGISYHKKRWIFEAQSTYAKVGLDSNQFSLGQNIYQPYNNREKDYGYITGGGINTTIMNNSFKVSFVLNPKMQTIIQLGVNNRRYKNDFVNESTNWFSFGIKTALINQYFDI
ncbi:MAG: hypothetical protein HYU68_08120 [Bacteroidetes bacterium]|nr:hypothetical protein [Bacteroidota bacterium]